MGSLSLLAAVAKCLLASLADRPDSRHAKRATQDVEIAKKHAKSPPIPQGIAKTCAATAAKLFVIDPGLKAAANPPKPRDGAGDFLRDQG
jgi:hypothetical protein